MMQPCLNLPAFHLCATARLQQASLKGPEHGFKEMTQPCLIYLHDCHLFATVGTKEMIQPCPTYLHVISLPLSEPGEYRGASTISHGGAWAGFRAHLCRYP